MESPSDVSRVGFVQIYTTNTKGDISIGKLVEELWDCPFCGNKRIRAGQKTCPSCGHPQDENTKFYMPDEIKYVSEEEAAKISRNPDWQCSFCGSLNSDSLDSCANCGATKEESERNYFEMRQQEEEKKRKKEEQKASSQKSDSEEPRKSFLKSILLLIGTFAAIAFIIFGLVSCFSQKVRNVTIDDFDWQRTIDVEEIVAYDESGWTLPDDARLLYTKKEIRSYKDVVDHYKTVSETKTKMVIIDHYEGEVSNDHYWSTILETIIKIFPVCKEETYTETSSEPVYRQEPVYDTKYYYEIDRWTVVDAAKSSGHDQNPFWPELKLKNGQRAGSKKEYYSVTTTYQGKKGKTKTEKYNMDFSEWKKLKKGEGMLKINFNGFAEINNKK